MRNKNLNQEFTPLPFIIKNKNFTNPKNLPFVTKYCHNRQMKET